MPKQKQVIAFFIIFSVVWLLLLLGYALTKVREAKGVGGRQWFTSCDFTMDVSRCLTSLDHTLSYDHTRWCFTLLDHSRLDHGGS